MKTMFQKVWERTRCVPETADTPAVLYIDLHLMHEVTSPQAFTVLRERGLKVRRPDRTLATMDHSTPDRAPSSSSAACRSRSNRRRSRCAQLRAQLRASSASSCSTCGTRPARHRAHHRPRARAHAAGHDHRLRRQPHQHARRLRRARLRHRHHRGRPRAGHAVPAAAASRAPSRSTVDGALPPASPPRI